MNDSAGILCFICSLSISSIQYYYDVFESNTNGPSINEVGPEKMDSTITFRSIQLFFKINKTITILT